LEELRIIALTGLLGYGYRIQSLRNGVELEPHLIGADNGSTDPGPYYLGSGQQLTKPAQVKRDLGPALIEARRLGIPLVIGSAGTAGGEPHLQAVTDVVHEIAREQRLHFRLAVIHAELSKSLLSDALASGRLHALPGAPTVSSETIASTERLVGQMGPEPFVAALESGADVVIAGRSCDTAIYAAMPQMHGYDIGLAFHMAKIMECGAQCAIPLAANDSLLGTLRRDHFLVQPLDLSRTVTPESVAAHAMYEQGNPFEIVEPGGRVDLTNATYEQVDSRTVRVAGSKWVRSPTYTIKVEGAARRGYATIAVAGARDPAILANLRTIEMEALRATESNLDGVLDPNSYTLRMRVYGRDGVLGALEPTPMEIGHEVGIVLEAIATSQEEADHALALLRSSVLHCPFVGRKTTAGNLAFPYSPSDIRVGPVYEFSVYHLLDVDHPLDLFPVEYIDV
jgi:hypothetical protein